MNRDHEIVIKRVFNAPRELVFDAFTQAKHIEKWWGPCPFTTRVEENHLVPGGDWRYVMVDGDGNEYPVEGRFVEIDRPYRFVTTDDFGEDYPDGKPFELKGLIVTATFEEISNQTHLTLVLSHPTVEVRQKHEEMGVIGGWESSFGCLDDFACRTYKYK